MKTLRIWDLPTRLFHWLLAAAIFALIATGRTGGDAIVWHFRLGYAVLAMLLFRLVWGVAGGHWSRFAVFFPTPARVLRYLRRQATPADVTGHNPLGALAVFAIIAIMLAQVVSGLMVDDEIFYQGPLTGRVPSDWIAFATSWHSGWGKKLTLGIIVLHVCAVLAHTFTGHKLIGPMFTGERNIPEEEAAALPASRDGAKQRLLALVVFAVAALIVWALVAWGNAAPSISSY
ncbi:MAG: cytochrome b/b6 domain-containing protein [Rhodocyclaceae bacterium]|nr:cytochrome b/b6 domain-containing protein [Rhodocyclaceae bacterium]